MPHPKAAAALALGIAIAAGAAIGARAAGDGPSFSNPESFSGDPVTGLPGFGLGGPAPSRPPERALPQPSVTGEASTGRDKAAGAGQAQAPAPDADDPEAARQRLLNTLFDRLKKSSDDLDARGVASAIERVWLHSGSDTADLLMSRALKAEHDDKLKVGVQILTKVIEIDPGWAEAWNERALLRVMSNNRDGAMGDIAHVLVLEPRHFGALAGLGAILRQSGDSKGALRVFRRVLELYPRQTMIKKIVDRLALKVEGRDL